MRCLCGALSLTFAASRRNGSTTGIGRYSARHLHSAHHTSQVVEHRRLDLGAAKNAIGESSALYLELPAYRFMHNGARVQFPELEAIHGENWARGLASRIYATCASTVEGPVLRLLNNAASLPGVNRSALAQRWTSSTYLSIGSQNWMLRHEREVHSRRSLTWNYAYQRSPCRACDRRWWNSSFGSSWVRPDCS